jgi:hypothetical protein
MKLLFILLLAGLTVSSSCKKNNNLNPVPSIPLDINININLPSYSALTGVGGWAYVEGGSKGIVVYRRSIDEFVAFDRHSPANDGTCEQSLVTNEDNFLQLDDLCSGATFSLYDGSPISGSEFGLRMYMTFFDGSDNLRIYN